jgi:hypothetical protein
MMSIPESGQAERRTDIHADTEHNLPQNTAITYTSQSHKLHALLFAHIERGKCGKGYSDTEQAH